MLAIVGDAPWVLEALGDPRPSGRVCASPLTAGDGGAWCVLVYETPEAARRMREAHQRRPVTFRGVGLRLSPLRLEAVLRGAMGPPWGVLQRMAEARARTHAPWPLRRCSQYERMH